MRFDYKVNIFPISISMFDSLFLFVAVRFPFRHNFPIHQIVQIWKQSYTHRTAYELYVYRLNRVNVLDLGN